MSDLTWIVLWGASFLWAYALILAIAWFRAVGRDGLETHVGHFVSLMAVMVPCVAVSLLIVLLAGGIGLTVLAPLLIITMPGGLVVSFQLEVSRLTTSTLERELVRLGLAAVLTAAFSANSVLA